MLSQNPSGGGQSEKDCREQHRVNGSTGRSGHRAARNVSTGRAGESSLFRTYSDTSAFESGVLARYVLQVTPGRERSMADRIKALADDLVQDCFVLDYQTLRKHQGIWHLETEAMFPGYVFISSKNVEALRERLKLSTEFVRLLGANRRIFDLEPREAAFIREFGGSDHMVGMSRGVIEEGRTIVEEGPLRGHVDVIRKIDRHKRVAYLDWGLLDHKQIKVGLEIVSKT